ncbi:MAG: hypothetical protein AAF788_05845 [Pseudomonadota bacterium]
MIRSFLSALLFFAGTALAGPLTTENVENFLAAAETLDKMAKDNPDFDIDIGSDDPTEVMENMISEDGQFRLFDVITNKLRADPEVNNEFLGVIRENGFADAQEFATIGDHIALTTMALSMGSDDLQQFQQLANMPAAQLQMIPPEMRTMIDRAQKLSRVVSGVPEQDKDTLRPYLDRLMAMSGN